jgi:hypothetical protein
MASLLQRTEAVRQILKQLYTLLEQGFPENRIGRIERETIFFLYEGLEKYSLDKPHSKAAREKRSEKNFSLQEITYDHAIPLATLRSGLRRATSSPDAMREFLARYVRGVVITREEDKKLNRGLRRSMPDGAEDDDLMARYRAANIGFLAEDEDRIFHPQFAD